MQPPEALHGATTIQSIIFTYLPFRSNNLHSRKIISHLYYIYQLAPCNPQTKSLFHSLKICSYCPQFSVFLQYILQSFRNPVLSFRYSGIRLYEINENTDPDFPEKHIAVSFRYHLLDKFLLEWQLRKKQLAAGEITREEYLEWKLNWPQTADDCGKHTPSKQWRKE